MRVTYYALRPVKVGLDQREPGDLIPEANTWPYLSGYIQDGALAPVLVATLPEESQMALLEWEEDQEKAAQERAKALTDAKAQAEAAALAASLQEPEQDKTPVEEKVKTDG